METIPLERNLFTARLVEFIMTNHPDRMEDTEFINERAAMASRTFENASMNGQGVDEAMAEAELILYQGLLFSPYQMVQEVVINEFDYTEVNEELEEFSLQMLDRVKPLIAAHRPDDNFLGSNDYPVLYDEIKESINQYLRQNGIQ